MLNNNNNNNNNNNLDTPVWLSVSMSAAAAASSLTSLSGDQYRLGQLPEGSHRRAFVIADARFSTNSVRALKGKVKKIDWLNKKKQKQKLRS